MCQARTLAASAPPMWSAAISLPPASESTHALPLWLRDVVGAYPIAFAPPRDQVRNHLALRADRRCAGLRGDPQHPVSAALGVLRVGLLGQGALVVDWRTQFGRERFYRLVAAHPVGRVHVGDAEGQQLRNQRLRLRAPPFVQRSLGVITGIA